MTTRLEKVYSIIKNLDGYFVEVDGKKIEEEWNNAETNFDLMQLFEENVILKNKFDPEKSYTIGIVQRRMFYNEKKKDWDFL